MPITEDYVPVPGPWAKLEGDEWWPTIKGWVSTRCYCGRLIIASSTQRAIDLLYRHQAGRY